MDNENSINIFSSDLDVQKVKLNDLSKLLQR